MEHNRENIKHFTPNTHTDNKFKGMKEKINAKFKNNPKGKKIKTAIFSLITILIVLIIVLLSLLFRDLYLTAREQRNFESTNNGNISKAQTINAEELIERFKEDPEGTMDKEPGKQYKITGYVNKVDTKNGNSLTINNTDGIDYLAFTVKEPKNKEEKHGTNAQKKLISKLKPEDKVEIIGTVTSVNRKSGYIFTIEKIVQIK